MVRMVLLFTQTQMVSDMKQVMFLTGKICSGKTYFAKHYAPNHTYLSVSSIVKGLISSNKRSELQQTSKFDKQIADEVIRFISQSFLSSDKVLIDGVRQLSILVSVLRYFKPSIITNDVQFRLVWLTVPNTILKKRYNKQTDKKNDLSFEEAIKRDNELGLFEFDQIITNFHLKYDSKSPISCHGLEPWCDVYELEGEMNE